MEPFLYTVAQWLTQKYNNSFLNIKLVFPNRRSSVFFMHHLTSVINKPVWLPKIQTISEFILDFSDLKLAEPIDLLSILYNIYKKESGSNEPFDDFYFWGELMLNDFNDIDKYLVDAEIVLKNVKSVKEIEDDFSYLTEEQIEVLRRFFKNFSQEKRTELKDNFLQVWQILLPVYKLFTRQLKNKQKGYEGLLYKEALNVIKEINKENFEFEKVIFIGFNALTPCEEEIFTIFKNLGLAEFCWDYDEYYIQNKAMEAGLFQRKFIAKYPNEELKENFKNLIDKNKQIQLVSTPTDHGQVFTASQIIESIKTKNYSNTALVLSDEQLLMPALNNIPQSVESINVTMGFPVSDTLSGNFIDLVIGLHQTKRVSKDNKTSFYYKSLLPLLRHPFIQFISNDTGLKTVAEIESENLYYVNVSELQQTELFKIIFKEVETSKSFGVYLSQLLTHIQSELWNGDKKIENFKFEKEFLFEIYQKNNQLLHQLQNNNLTIHLPTYFRLLKKVIMSIRAPFEGEPISGLQIMGFLETRNLDFENVIILSVNEGVLPINNQSTSFIPYSLRRGFGLPTRELHDAMYAYYFYRIIQRAKNVYLVYNSGTSGMQTGEKSRFAYQLLFDNHFNIKEVPVSQTIEILSNQTINIQKEGKVWEKLNVYLNSDSKLSPSALNVYLTCPLRFYFKLLVGIKEPDEVEEKVDARLFGNIFHLAAEKLYQPFKENKLLITDTELTKLENDGNNIDTIIKESFKNVFLGEKSEREFEIDGKNLIVFNVIKKYLLQLLQRDKSYAPFSILGLELNVQHKINISVEGKNRVVNIGGQIDRLDKNDLGVRVIDYKTGGDKLEFNELNDVFDIEHINETKAIFQTFVYSLIVANNKLNEPSIIPMVYQVKNLFGQNQAFEITSKNCEPFRNGNFKDIEGEVNTRVTKVLEELFNKSVPFTQTENRKPCKNCAYKQFCGR